MIHTHTHTHTHTDRREFVFNEKNFERVKKYLALQEAYSKDAFAQYGMYVCKRTHCNRVTNGCVCDMAMS